MTIPTGDIGGLWHAYKSDGQRAARDELIVRYAPLVHFVAGRVAVGLPPTVDRADLVSYGIFGLIDAIERFDPTRGYRFETYAVARIRGHMLDELRTLDWVPRAVRRRAREIEETCGALEAELHRAPNDAELAEALGCSLHEVQRDLAQTAVVNLVAFDAAVAASTDGDPATTVGDSLVVDEEGPGEVVELAETRRVLADGIARLADRERTVVALYYHDGLTLAEIGEVLGVTESRVCQIHSKAVMQLRLHMGAAEREPA
ncbi:MAG TPA: FliA/WhiG family RNA polymerase sigma factor [Acidimicrobiales bacterium]